MIRAFQSLLWGSALLALTTAAAVAVPIITATKDDNLARGLRKLPGNTITYTITIGNSGDATATSVLFTDPDPANATFVSVNSSPSRATILSARSGMQKSAPTLHQRVPGTSAPRLDSVLRQNFKSPACNVSHHGKIA